MKILMINGSPRCEGNTHIALSEIASTLHSHGVATEIFWIGAKPVQGCTACAKCKELGRCVFNDELYETLREKIAQCDGLVIGSPTYYAGPAGALCAILDRLFYSSRPLLAYKVGAAITVCRRGGASASLDRLNKYFTITNMPLAPSQYWNLVYGRAPGEASLDAEGMQTMRTLAHNIAWLLKNLPAHSAPTPTEQPVATNFIR